MDITMDADTESSSSGRSNTGYIEKRLKDKTFKNCQKFTEIDEEFLDEVRQMIAQGTLAKKIAQKIKKEIETVLEPLEVLTILRKHIRSTTPEIQQNQITSKREVILSGYLMKSKGVQ